jgi:hypothetical protein
VIAYRATLNVPTELAWFVAEQCRRGTPKGCTTASSWRPGESTLTRLWQALLGLRWFRDRTTSAIAHTLLNIAYIALKTGTGYQDPGVAFPAGQTSTRHQPSHRIGQGRCRTPSKT